MYRAVNKSGDTVDFLLTAKRDMAAARCYLECANTAAIRIVSDDACVDIELSQTKYLNNIIEQDHRAVKRITDPMLGIKSFWIVHKN